MKLPLQPHANSKRGISLIQCLVYLGMLGVPTPPIYGLTSEEVRARSES